MIEWIATFLYDSGPILAAGAGLVVTWILLPIIISISYAKHLVDEPIGLRKIHTDVTPNLGGVAFYFSLITIFLLSGYAGLSWVPYMFGGLTLLFFSGIKDDILVISAWRKLTLQIIAVLALILGGDIIITDLGGVFGINEISYWAGVVLTGFTMIVVINAYNLIDGIDGLAGSIGLIATVFFGSWFWYVGFTSHAVLAFICAGSLLAFLRFNFQPASIFMGDTGSQVIGFMLAFFAVSFVEIGVTSSSYVPFQNEIPILVLSILIVPLYDTLRVFTLRTLRRGSPFKADRLHIHHQLLDLGFSDKSACYIIAGLNLTMIGLTLLLAGLNVNILLGVVLLTSAILFPTIGLKRSLIQKLGFKLPSARHIHVLERMYGAGIKSVGRRADSKEEYSEEEWEKVAV